MKNFESFDYIQGDPDYADQLTLTTLPDGSTEFRSGLSFDFLLLLEFALNFSHIAIKGEGWPDRFPNGTWSGLTRQVIENEADLSITQSAFVDIRVRDFSFLTTMTMGYLVASFKQPPSHSLTNVLTTSLHPELWGSLFMLAVFVMASVKLMGWIRMKYVYWDPNKDLNDLTHSDEAAYWVLVTFCQRTYVGTPKSTPMQIIYISLTITSIVAYTALSATLMSTLAIAVVPIKSFADLVSSKLDVYGDSSASFTHRFVQDVAYQRRQIQGYGANGENLSFSSFMDIHTGLRRTLYEPIAYVTFDGAPLVAYRKMGLTDDFACSKISHFRVPGSAVAGGMFVRKGSFLRQIFNPKIVSFYQYGFIKRVQDKWSSTPSRRCRKKVKSLSTEPMDIGNVHTPIVVLIGGFVISIVALSIEFNYRLFFIEYNSLQFILELGNYAKGFIIKGQNQNNSF